VRPGGEGPLLGRGQRWLFQKGENGAQDTVLLGDGGLGSGLSNQDTTLYGGLEEAPPECDFCPAFSEGGDNIRGHKIACP